MGQTGTVHEPLPAPPDVSLIFRAIWQDEAAGLHDRAEAAFVDWVGRHHSAERSFAVGEVETVDGVTTRVEAGAGEAGSIQRCTLEVDDGVQVTTTTLTTTVPTEDTEGPIWIDQARVSHRATPTTTVHPPDLVTRLVATGRAPRRGPTRLQATPRALRPGEVPAFVERLVDPARDLPLVVFAGAPEIPPDNTRQAAEYAALVLAGSALVHLIGPAGLVHLRTLLGEDLGVEPGAVRVYLPGVSPTEPRPSRHRWLDAERVVRDPRAVPHTILGLLAPVTTARRPPTAARELLPLLHADLDALRARNDHLEARVLALEDQLARAQDEKLDHLGDLEEAEGRINLLQAALHRFSAAGATAAAAGPDDPPPDVGGLAAAAEAAKRHLPGIVLPDEACRDLAELDQRVESAAWGRTAWRGLQALNAFALDSEFGPGFWEWCKANRSAFSWPASSKKLAMRESETVMSNESLRSRRVFPVDPAVAASGRIEMQAHLKIAEGGNHQIPRIYFHDDRHGATGKVHIGFFGPHRHVPNTLT